MIDKMMFGVLGVAVAGFLVGIAHSSFKHYYEKYAEEQDLSDGSVQKVTIVKDETKKTRGRKK
jgi:hypothetical protein